MKSARAAYAVTIALRVALFAAAIASVGLGACKKKDAGEGGGAATATASGSAAASGSGSAAAPAARADVAAFAAIFDPVNSKLDHVSRARTACEQRQAIIDAAKAIDKTTAPAGKDAAAWTASVEALQLALDETGDPCDEGNIKGIEAKLDAAKSALDGLTK